MSAENLLILSFPRRFLSCKCLHQIDGISGKTLSYKNICDEANLLASSLLNLGILPGETITVSCENRMNYPALMLSSVFVGAVFNPINPAYGPGEFGFNWWWWVNCKQHILTNSKTFCKSLLIICEKVKLLLCFT